MRCCCFPLQEFYFQFSAYAGRKSLETVHGALTFLFLFLVDTLDGKATERPGPDGTCGYTTWQAQHGKPCLILATIIVLITCSSDCIIIPSNIQNM